MFTERTSSAPRESGSLLIVWGVILLILAFVGGWFGAKVNAGTTVQLADGTVVSKNIARQLEQDVEFAMFWEVWDLVQDRYLRGPVPEKDLFYAAIEGMVEGTGDPYTTFFPPVEAEAFETDLSGRFEGIGAEIGIRDGQLMIISPLEDSPAMAAGIRAGDEIYFIDETDTQGMSVEEAVRRIRGPRGSEVVLSVLHEGGTELEDVAISRDVIEFSSVEVEFREDGIAVIDVQFFNEDTARRFNDAVVEIGKREVTGVVLDLRNNPGGFLDRAITVAGDWVGAQTVVIERMEDGIMNPMAAQGIARLEGLETVVLVNGGSASASEIVAGALQDYEAATIIGTQTFGKGSVQEYHEFADGSGVKITIAEWLTPQGRTIQEVGISPDEVVEFTAEDFEAGLDPQMDRAVELLTQ